MFSADVSKVPSATVSGDNLSEKSASFSFTQGSIIKEIQCLNLKIIVNCLSPGLSEYESYLKNISSLSLKDLPPVKSTNRGFLANLAGNEDYNIYFKYGEKAFTDFVAFQDFIPSLGNMIVRKLNFFLFRNLPCTCAQLQNQRLRNIPIIGNKPKEESDC